MLENTWVPEDFPFFPFFLNFMKAQNICTCILKKNKVLRSTEDMAHYLTFNLK